jgi:hypothetical protein
MGSPGSQKVGGTVPSAAVAEGSGVGEEQLSAMELGWWPST